jgi:hypothetical protein
MPILIHGICVFIWISGGPEKAKRNVRLLVLGFIALCVGGVLLMAADLVGTCATYGWTIKPRAAYTFAHAEDTKNPYNNIESQLRPHNSDQNL